MNKFTYAGVLGSRYKPLGTLIDYVQEEMFAIKQDTEWAFIFVRVLVFQTLISSWARSRTGNCQCYHIWRF